jgi:restriction system protein
MAEIAVNRVGELLQGVFELLWSQPEGLSASEIISVLPHKMPLNDFEIAVAPAGSVPQYERIIRLATVPFARAGWLVRNPRGRWHITEQGRAACRRWPDIQTLHAAALRRSEEIRRDFPSFALVAQEAEERAWTQIQQYLRSASRAELVALVADLLRALGLHIGWITPDEKFRGQIDLVAQSDPAGEDGKRTIVQVSHSGRASTLEHLDGLLGELRSNDRGLLFSSGGFSDEVLAAVGNVAFRSTVLWNLERFVELWTESYERLSPEARRRLPIKAVHFLDGVGGS